MANSIKSDVFEIMQYEVKPGTKEKLNFDERNIVAGLNHKTIKSTLISNMIKIHTRKRL